ncbi:putative quinate permease, partial [Colletotrichum tanaceti]
LPLTSEVLSRPFSSLTISLHHPRRLNKPRHRTAMGILAVVEERPTPPSVYNWRIYALACIASCGSCMIGYTSAFIGTTVALDSFKSEFGLDRLSTTERNLVSENIVSLFVAGAFFGALLTYCLSHFIGRKWCLAIGATTFSLGAGLTCGANGSLGLGILYAGRVFSGLGTGVASNIIPIYISELSPPAIRGRLVGLYELGWQIGGMVGFWINYGVEAHVPSGHTQWIIPFAVQLIPSGLLLLGSMWIRESPRWLFLKDHRKEAMENLCWIRQLEPNHIYIQEEIAAIDKIYETQKATVGVGFWQPFQALAARPKLQWRLFLGCMLFFWQNGSGINAINYYSPTIFSSIGIDSNTVNLMTGIFGVIKAIMTFLWLLFLVDQLGRRKLLLIGAVTGSICMWVIGAYVCVVEPTKNPQDHLTGSGYAAIVFFYLWTAVYTPTWNGTPWVINSEFFDPNFRSLAGGATTASNWLFNFLVSRFTEQMFEAMGYGVYFFFASLSFLAFFFAFFLIPETSGVPLEKVDRLFEIKPVWRANETLMAQLRDEEVQFRTEAKGDTTHNEHTGGVKTGTETDSS